MKFLICLTLAFVTNLSAKDLLQERFAVNPDSSNNQESNIQGYSIPDSVLEKFPSRNQNYLNRFYPGVVSYFQNFYTRGGKNYETGFYLDGIKFNNLFTGENSFLINPDAFERIDFYNGFIPADIGSSSAGLFNYKLKTGGDKLNFNVEHLTDNITFTNDAFSGDKRLGAYYYGYNETNFNFGGPLYFPNVRFFANVNYLFQRDKNPQRYPGMDNLSFYDQSTSDSITINLPAGIVPYNSFESINFLSTLLLNFENIKIKASGIYFDENEFTERNHILDYLNTRLGLIDKSGGIFNVNFDHKVNDIISYSLNGNYYQKSEMTTDQYLGDNYWSYGDSVANAEAGIYWQREGDYYGRYVLPSRYSKQIFTFGFTNTNFPGIDYEKSGQERFSISGNIKFDIHNHLLKIGGEYNHHKLTQWQLPGQYQLAGKYAGFREDTYYDEYNDEELRDLSALLSGANNFGYDSDGDESNSGLNKAPEPVFYSIYIDDQYNVLDDLFFYLGVRYDHFEYDYKKMIDPTLPEKTFNKNSLTIYEDGLKNTEDYSFLSPKAYIKFSPLNNLFLVADYSQNVQSHPFYEMYQGISSIGYNLGNGFFVPNPVRTGDLKPVVSSGYDFSISYSPLSNLNHSLTYYNKETKNQTSLELQNTNENSVYGAYIFYGDNISTDIWGLEYQIEYYKNGINLISNINYQNIDEKLLGNQFSKFTFNGFVNYDFFNFQKISTVFWRLNLSVLFRFNSGHAYMGTPDPYRPSIETTPNVYQLDMKIEKGFSVFNNLNLDFYIYVINLLNTKNVYDVFPRIGSAEDDGYLGDPNQGGILLETYGEQFGALYTLNNKYNPNYGQQTFYGPPRQIGFGIKLNY